MPINSDTVLSHTYLFCVAAAICAFPVYGIIRKKTPGIGWHRHGNVSTASLNILDILGLCLFFGIYASFLMEHLAPAKLDDNGDPVTTKLTPVILAVYAVVQLVPPLLVGVMLVYRQINLIDFFGLARRNTRHLLIIAPAGVILAYTFYIGIEQLGYTALMADYFGDEVKVQETVKSYQQTKSVTVRMMIAFNVILIAPIAEEIVFRGYIYTATKRFSDRFFAATLSSLLFGVVHFNIMALVPLVVLALILAIAYELSGSLWAPISIHALFNATTIIFQEAKFH